MNQPRRHHFVSEFFLAGFTKAGTKEDKLWALDLDTLNQFASIPKNHAHRRDFYKVDLPGVDPGAFEKAFGEFECEAAEVVRSVIQAQVLPDGRDFEILLNLVALFFVRVPAFREAINRPMERLNKQILRLTAASRGRWESTQAKMRAAGTGVEEDCTYENMRRFVEKDRYTIEPCGNTNLSNLMNTLDTDSPLLGQRAWSLLVASSDAPDFICSDRPVALYSTQPLPPLFGPSLGMPNTVVLFPLSRRLALVGSFEGEDGTVIEVDRPIVAEANARVVDQAQRFVYSAGEDFVVMKPDGTLGDATDVVEHLKSKARKGDQEEAE